MKLKIDRIAFEDLKAFMNDLVMGHTTKGLKPRKHTSIRTPDNNHLNFFIVTSFIRGRVHLGTFPEDR